MAGKSYWRSETNFEKNKKKLICENPTLIKLVASELWLVSRMKIAQTSTRRFWEGEWL